MAYSLALTAGQRAQRKALITIASWTEGSSAKAAILGARVEDSSIDFNADVETSTDILGINYTDVNRTQPQQTFDPAYIIGGDDLAVYMNEAMLANNIDAYNGKFDVYVVAAYYTEATSGSTTTTKYRTVKHAGCSIIPQSLGGESFVAMPFDVYFSNNITMGYVDSIAKEDLLQISTEFTADT